ncbi:MAG: type II toxin-antitoxin system VapC family toxin [Gemmatimonadales bacterium]
MILLDTSFLVRALVHRSPEDGRLRTWLREGEAIGIPSLAWAEFLCGPVSPDGIAAALELLHEPIPFGAAEAARAAHLFNASGRRRGSLVDCMIAATAMESSALLATANPADFGRFTALGLRLAD